MHEVEETVLHKGDLATASRYGEPDVTAKTEEVARQIHETSRLILDAAGDGIYGLDLEGYVTFVNPAAREMTGWSIDDFRGRTQHSMVHHSRPDGSPYPREDCPIYQALRDGQIHHREDEVFWRKDGSSFPVSYTSTPILRDGMPAGAVIIFSDIRQRLKQQAWEKNRSALFFSVLTQDAIEVTLAMLTQAFETLHDGAWLAVHLRRDRTLFVLNCGSMPKAVIDGLEEVAIAEDSCMCGRTAFWGKEQQPFEVGDHVSEDQHMLQCLPLFSSHGELLGTISLSADPGRQDLEQVVQSLQSAADLARLALEHSELQQQLRHQAQHDLLTGLPNRLLLQDRLDQAIASAKRRHTAIGVCFIDLDRFKQINDTLGHGIGDEYLKKICSILKGNCREVDTLARQGGDEFILLLPDLADGAEILQIVTRCLNGIQEAFFIDGNWFNATASIGISVFPQHGETPSLLLQNADTALYAAKRGGRNRSAMYHPDMGTEVKEHAWVYSGLQQALLKNELRLVYQPLYSLEEKITGFEALLRWDHPVDGPIPPDRFIPIAEETGLIVPIGQWVLEEACRQAVSWQTDGYAAVSMAVNVSGVQLGRPEFVQMVQTTLENTGLTPSLLHLEITETWIVVDPKAAAAKLKELQAVGVKLSIDDFGTGQSSFGCLHDLPLDTLKIDRSFIARLDGSSHQLATVRAIIHLAQQLGLRTVAEGVETIEQLEELRSVDCNLLQGYLMAKPLAPDKAGLLLERAQTTHLLADGVARPATPLLLQGSACV